MGIDYINSIKKSAEHLSSEKVARKIYLSYPTQIFIGKEDEEFDLCNEISDFFSIPLGAIAVVGSAKLGYSAFKKQDFDVNKSDIDIAIIDPQLFIKFFEISFIKSNGYDATKFRTDRNNKSLRDEYVRYISKGIFRPDLMPYCEERQELWNFLNRLSRKYSHHAKKISIGMYLTEKIFLEKQKSIVSAVERNFGVIE